ncbi:hypothetical protein AGMMS49992_11850 [Clostridia bacterium]|nr:hypothetical protein AGMMS49992_11850 [Clostridia bacterium]
MNGIELINEIDRSENQIQSKRDKIAALSSIATNACSHMSGMPRSATPDRQPLQALSASILDLENEINDQIGSLIDLKEELIPILSEMPCANHRKVIALRYFERMNWQQLSTAMHYSLRQIKRIHDEAINKLKKMSDNA